MIKYVLKRLLLMIPVLLGVSFIVYGIMSFTPGDPASAILGTSATKEQIDKLNEELGMNDPFVVRYVHYLEDALHGDFGTSYRTRQPVFDEIFSRFGVTFRIGVLSICLAVMIGVPIGVAAIFGPGFYQYHIRHVFCRGAPVLAGNDVCHAVFTEAGPSALYLYRRGHHEAFHHARGDPGHGHGSQHTEADPFQHAGDHTPGLCKDWAGKGRIGTHCYLQARAQKCAAAGYHGHW